MKKKIAVCGNGWNYDSLLAALDGINEYASREDFDVFVFLSFASYSEHSTLSQGELNIYRLLDPEDYDGVVVLSTALNSVSTAESICRRALERHVPVVSIGLEMEGVHSVCISNDDGMRSLVNHLIEEHGVKRAFFIGGTVDHVDSIARLQVTKECFEAHGLSLNDDDVAYGRWANRYTQMAVDELLDSGKPLPDAIICANDIMAMAACTQLENRGILVPQDILVTGFDNCREGKIFYPALSSVEQNYKEIGEKACDIIYRQIRGEQDVKREMISSSFSCGESCGCAGDLDYEALRILYCRHSYKRNADARLLEQNERVMRAYLTDMPNYSVLKETICNHYRNNHQFEGDGFYIIVNENYFSDVMISEEEIWNHGQIAGTKELVSLVNGEIVSDLPVGQHMIVPGYEKKDGEQHVYFFMPMHYFENNYGYVVLMDYPYLVQGDMLYPYMEKLQQSIRLMRTNLRLKELYDKDQMTGLYNRFGYEGKALPLYEESLQNLSSVMVMFVDINYMKRINDVHGHLHGDNAIRTVVAAINANIPEGSIAVRFGGDEFLIIAPGCNQEKALQVKEGILGFLEEKNAEKVNPYDISVSIGYVVSDPKGRPTAALQDYIREADKLMYEIKKEMHMRMDRRKPRE
ncbi:MAG: GGDEF domain-containing protein [Lachnospiraceae bacterium]|nr:GGDEF domain-containing protein [Lachnospiraceae bacterium]